MFGSIQHRLTILLSRNANAQQIDLVPVKNRFFPVSLKIYENACSCAIGGRPAHLALPGGLITGVLAPLAGGGTFISESRVAGGQITPFESESFLPRCLFSLPPSAGAHCSCFDGGVAWAKAGVPENSQNAAAILLSSFRAGRA
jgi:hypothetical protein